jgi:hypothetical protein
MPFLRSLFLTRSHKRVAEPVEMIYEFPIEIIFGADDRAVTMNIRYVAGRSFDNRQRIPSAISSGNGEGFGQLAPSGLSGWNHLGLARSECVSLYLALLEVEEDPSQHTS